MTVRIKDFLLKYESKIILILGFTLIASISFEAGIIKGKGYAEKPVLIENAASNQTNSDISENSDKPAEKAQEEKNNIKISDKNCPFLGSKNSNKYHLPSCRWAKNIKPENQVCFSSENDAKSKGYLPDKNCIK